MILALVSLGSHMMQLIKKISAKYILLLFQLIMRVIMLTIMIIIIMTEKIIIIVMKLIIMTITID